MRVGVIGGTGFIGRALVAALGREGHHVTVVTRSETGARGPLAPEVELVAAGAGQSMLSTVVERSDAVVNLAGEPIFGRRWTEARRAQLRASRVEATEQIVRAIARSDPRPRVLVSGSAVGYYGDRGEEPLPESASPGDDFLAHLCQDWEAAARAAAVYGVRVVMVRSGVALGRDGGALAQMLPPFRLGVGGPVGSGRQYFPWIHLHDLVRIITAALSDDRYQGPINAVAPDQATNRSFARALGRALGRPAIVPTPALLLRVMFGESASVVLASQRAEPRALCQLGFIYSFPTLDAALGDILGTGGGVGA